MSQVIKTFNEGKCTAAILRDSAFVRLPAKDQDRLKIILRTQPLPNQTITVSARLRNNASKLADFMLSRDGAIAAEGILSRYSKTQKHFEKASIAKYSGIEDLLEGVVFGW